ncbi:hypothetical protein ASJ81_11455 [Methanosarcina spelaei]|uniref:DUF1330 domain-containing protein n=1 Tax=Methanosarcina spelaei TaxID=1036679 RepID=A0A2A2HP77_9EURY|nr:DUF1330 domain-containing protein [Methanosarcina spelaei]PAV11086.1 hypothetical protein ASJ81_11455 [Methanosarcina spelaei]
MPVYMIIEIKVIDYELYTKYVEKVPEIIKKYGGRYLVRGDKVLPMFGNWNPERIVIIEFETEEQVRNCFNSAEYLKVAPFRENSTITKSVIVNGYLPSE